MPKTIEKPSRDEISEKMAPPASHKALSNLTAFAYQQLRADVLSGRLVPGEKLRAEALRQRFNIGSSPIREALNRLLAEGFVALEAQKGFRVAPVSETELNELVTARCLIDGSAIRASIKRYETKWEEGLVLALHRLTRAARITEEGTPNTDWEQRHRHFHRALVGGCGSRWIVRISEQLFDAAERYRLLAADYVKERNELEEHQALAQACLDRDADKAIELLSDHFGQTYAIVADFMKNDGKGKPF
jgi:GntR family transcriptional regulator, carbon starvation induced regulator